MKHTIEIHELTIVTQYGVENAIKVFDATENKQLSYCQTHFDNSREMFAAVESGNVKNEDKVYKAFDVDSEEELRERIINIAYDAWIEKKLLEFDIDDDF